MALWDDPGVNWDDPAVNWDDGATTTQVLTPTTDTNVGVWTRNPVGAPDTLASALAEKSEADVIELDSANFPSTARFKLSAGSTPGAGDRTFAVRVARTGSSSVAFTATLREGGGTTVGGGTLKGTASITRSADGWATVPVLITEAIADYTDLYVEITADTGA